MEQLITMFLCSVFTLFLFLSPSLYHSLAQLTAYLIFFPQLECSPFVNVSNFLEIIWLLSFFLSFFLGKSHLVLSKSLSLSLHTLT